MSTKDIKTELDACKALAYGKWVISDGVDLPLTDEQKPVLPPGATWVTFKGLDRALIAMFSPNGMVMVTQRVNLDDEGRPVHGSQPDLFTPDSKAQGVFARFAVRLAEGQPIPEVPNTLPADWK